MADEKQDTTEVETKEANVKADKATIEADETEVTSKRAPRRRTTTREKTQEDASTPEREADEERAERADETEGDAPVIFRDESGESPNQHPVSVRGFDARATPNPGVVVYPWSPVSLAAAQQAERDAQPALAQMAVANLITMNPNYTP